MADLLQGAPLPSTITTSQQQTTVPDFYTNYLQDVANLGQNAVTQGGVAGFGPLQQQAFQMAPNAAFSGAQTAGTGADMLTLAGSTASPQLVSNYMNPYTNNVVNEMARLQQQNIQRNVLPSLAGAGVGTGSFGSKRQAQATGQSLADMQSNLLGQQYGALNTGFKDAISAAQADLTRQLQAGQGMGNVANIQQNIGQGGLKTLSDLGQKQQELGQAQLNYPMLQAQNLSKLFQGVTLPTGQTTQTTKPGEQGQYANSPLSQISSLIAALQGVSGGTTGGTTGGNSNLSNSILGLPAAAVNSIKDFLGTFGISFAEGGQVRGYADGGTVDAVPTDVTLDPLDPSQFYNIGTQMSGMAYTGGTPNFNEATGEYVNQPSRGDNPLPWERGAVSPIPNHVNEFINKIKQRSEQRRNQQGNFNPWNRPGQPTPLPAPTGTNATIGNPNQGGYNPKPSQSNLDILNANGKVIGVRDVFPTQSTVTPPQPTGGLPATNSMDDLLTKIRDLQNPVTPATVTTQDKFVPPTQPDYSKYNLPADVVAALNNSWQNYAKNGYGATDMGYTGYDPATGLIKGYGGMYAPGSNTGMSIDAYQKQLADFNKQQSDMQARIKELYPNGVPDQISLGDLGLGVNSHLDDIKKESLEKEFKKKQLGLDNTKQKNKKLNDWHQKWSDHYDKNLAARS